jgi:hypothetical protein
MLAQWQTCVQLVEDIRLVQQHLLADAMLQGARWTIDEFKRLYWQHPLTRYMAQTLIWGVYQGENLRATFRITPELTLSSSRDRDYRLPRITTARIGVVHPRQLTAQTARQWRTILFDYGILQPFKQLALAFGTQHQSEQQHSIEAMDHP